MHSFVLRVCTKEVRALEEFSTELITSSECSGFLVGRFLGNYFRV